MTNLVKTLCTLLFPVITYAQKNIFAAEWQIDSLKSDYGNLSPDVAIPKYISVNYWADSLIVKREFINAAPFTQTLVLDSSKTIQNVSDDGKTLRTYSVGCQGDQSLIFKSHFQVFDNNPWEYDRIEIWTLSEDKTVLTIKRNTLLPNGKVDKVVGIYRKLSDR